jgi:hypothetical protein
LEWNLKVTAQDLPHIVEKFVAEFETYWNSREFIPFSAAEPELLRRSNPACPHRHSDSAAVF